MRRSIKSICSWKLVRLKKSGEKNKEVNDLFTLNRTKNEAGSKVILIRFSYIYIF